MCMQRRSRVGERFGKYVCGAEQGRDVFESDVPNTETVLQVTKTAVSKFL